LTFTEQRFTMLVQFNQLFGGMEMKTIIFLVLATMATSAAACVMPATNASDVAWQLFYQCEAAQQQGRR
jgi:ABC-type lipoprotein release transport system permease subunit